MLDKDQLSRIESIETRYRDRPEAAPNPWEVLAGARQRPDTVQELTMEQIGNAVVLHDGVLYGPNNPGGEFIRESPGDIRWLLALVEELQEEIDVLEAEVE